MTRKNIANGWKTTSENMDIRRRPASIQRRKRRPSSCSTREAWSSKEQSVGLTVTASVRKVLIPRFFRPANYFVEHLHPRFCPEKLISYKSQGDDPAEFLYFHSLQPTDLNITIGEGDRSNRMPDGWLEHAWGIPTQSGVLHLPQWAKRDEIVQCIINEEEVDEITYHGDRKRSIRKVSLTPKLRAEEHVDNMAEVKQNSRQDPEGKRGESAVGLESKPESPSNTSKALEANANTRAGQPAEPISKAQSHSKARASTKPTRRNPRRAVSVLGMLENKRCLQAQASGIKKRPRTTKRKTKAVTLSGRPRTRAQGTLKT